MSRMNGEIAEIAEFPADLQQTADEAAALAVEGVIEAEVDDVKDSDPFEKVLEIARSLAHTQGRDQEVEYEGKSYTVTPGGEVVLRERIADETEAA